MHKVTLILVFASSCMITDHITPHNTRRATTPLPVTWRRRPTCTSRKSTASRNPLTRCVLCDICSLCVKGSNTISSVCKCVQENCAVIIHHISYCFSQVVQLLQSFKASNNAHEQEVFACMIHNLFDEYRFFPRYPDKVCVHSFWSLVSMHMKPLCHHMHVHTHSCPVKTTCSYLIPAYSHSLTYTHTQELHITALLFGALVGHQLVSSITLGMALRYVQVRKRLCTVVFIHEAATICPDTYDCSHRLAHVACLSHLLAEMCCQLIVHALKAHVLILFSHSPACFCAFNHRKPWPSLPAPRCLLSAPWRCVSL